jgi:formylglycine-generating enzyme required for sulfatase activity
MKNLNLSFRFISICQIILCSLTISAQETSYKSGELLVKELPNGKETYILKNGKYPFTGSWEMATEFSNGYALVADSNIYYGIDTTGKILFAKKGNADVSINYANEGMYSIVDGLRIGFLNHLGDQVIPTIYGGVAGATPWFSEGICVVIDSTESKYLFINKKGEQAIDFIINGTFGGAGTYQYPEFHNGLCMAHENYKFGFINHQGEWVIKPKYDAVADFSEGLAAVSNLGEVFFINTKGNKVFNRSFGVMYDEGCCGFSYGSFKNGEAMVNVDISQNHINPRDFFNKNQIERNSDLDKFAIINRKGKIIRLMEQTSNESNKKHAYAPYMKSHYCEGITIVPGGTLINGGGYGANYLSEDTTLLYPSAVSVDNVASFYISDHEVSNAEYREFVNWVRDSIARCKLFVRVSGEEKKMWGKYTDTVTENIDLQKRQYFVLNWETKLDYSSAEIAFLLSDMYFSSEERINHQKQFDPRKWNYIYTDFNNDVKNSINPYPDTLCWTNEFKFSNFDPITNNYFWHPAYDNYPVVGVSWKQTQAYCDWRTKRYNEELNKMNDKKKSNYVGVKFTLPNSNQWSYASGSDQPNMTYKNLPYNRNEQGCYTANFGSIYLNSDLNVKNLADDGAFLTAKVKSYSVNFFGLYNMFGNVSEWTNDNPTANPDNFFKNLINRCSSIFYDSTSKDKQIYITDPYTKTTQLVSSGSPEHKKIIEQRLQFYNISPNSSVDEILKNYIAFNSVDSSFRDKIRKLQITKWLSDKKQDQIKTDEKNSDLNKGPIDIDGVIITEELPIKMYENPLELYNNYSGCLETMEKKWTEQKIVNIISELKQNWEVIERAERIQNPLFENAIDKCRIVQGGSWVNQPHYLNATCKEVYHESEASCKIGFRVIMEATIIEENGICKNCTSNDRKKMKLFRENHQEKGE